MCWEKVKCGNVPSIILTRRELKALVGRHADRQTDRQTGRQTRRHAERQTDRQTDRQADTQTDRHADTQRDRQTDIAHFSVLPCSLFTGVNKKFLALIS